MFAAMFGLLVIRYRLASIRQSGLKRHLLVCLCLGRFDAVEVFLRSLMFWLWLFRLSGGHFLVRIIRLEGVHFGLAPVIDVHHDIAGLVREIVC